MDTGQTGKSSTTWGFVPVSVPVTIRTRRNM
jgi:hypothetical protein